MNLSHALNCRRCTHYKQLAKWGLFQMQMRSIPRLLQGQLRMSDWLRSAACKHCRASVLDVFHQLLFQFVKTAELLFTTKECEELH